MKKQNLITFTKLGFAALMTLAAAAASASALSFTNIRANIPFDFTIGEKTLPAGKYTLQRISPNGTDTLLIRSEDGKAGAIGLTNAVRASTSPTQTKLIFHRYGNSYFLSEVWTDGDDIGRRLLQSRSERELERELAAYPVKGEPAEMVSEIVSGSTGR